MAQTAFRTRPAFYRHSIAAAKRSRRAEAPLFQAFLRPSSVKVTDGLCIKDTTTIDIVCGTGGILSTMHDFIKHQNPDAPISNLVHLSWLIALNNCNATVFCSGVRFTQLSNNCLRSGVNSTISPLEKNWESVIPIPRQMASKVGIEGIVFLLKIFAIVDSERPQFLASRYSVQPLSLIKQRSRSRTSTKPPSYCHYFTVQVKSFILPTCRVNMTMLNGIL